MSEQNSIDEVRAQLAESERLRRAENEATARCITAMREARAAELKAVARAEAAESRVKEVEALLAQTSVRNCVSCDNTDCPRHGLYRETFCDLYVSSHTEPCSGCDNPDCDMCAHKMGKREPG